MSSNGLFSFGIVIFIIHMSVDIFKQIRQIFYRRSDVSFVWENQLKNPVFHPCPTRTPYIYMFCIVNIVGPTVRDVIAADIILSRVIKLNYADRE